MVGIRFPASWARRAAGVLALFFTLPSSAATIQMAPGTTMEMEPPAGQCLIEPSASQFDASYFVGMQQLYAGTNKLAAYFIPCDALADLRQGVATPLNTWTAVLLPLSGGQVISAPGHTRTQALDALVKAAAGTDMQAYLDGQMGSIEDRVAQVIQRDAYQNQIKSMGVLARDESALYSGLLMTQTLGGQVQSIACVFAMTLINGYMVSVNIYLSYEGPHTFSAMVDMLRGEMATLVNMNGGKAAAPPAPAVPPSDLETGLEDDEATEPALGGDNMTLLLVGGTAVVLIGGLIGFLVTRRRPEQG